MERYRAGEMVMLSSGDAASSLYSLSEGNVKCREVSCDDISLGGSFCFESY